MPEYSFICEDCEIGWCIVCSIGDYTSCQACPQCKKTEYVNRDYMSDQVHSHYVHGLHECKTVGHYAEKQTKMYGKEKYEKMQKSFKTKKKPYTGMKELPTGMSRGLENTSRITKKEAEKKRKKKND